MDWGDVRVFLAIARAGTLVGAGRTLGLTQPTMGRRLSALETAVGHKLFQRSANGFAPTDEGFAMLAHAERMEEEALAIERQVAGQAQELEGLLRVTSFDWFAARVLTPVLAEFAQRHPSVTVELLTDTRFLNLSRREADLAFRIGPFDEADVVSRRLMRISYGVFTRKGSAHPAQGGGAGCTLMALDTAFAGTPDDSWLQTMLPQARTVFRSNSRDVQAHMCAQGAGIAVLPLALGETIEGLERVVLGEAPPSREMWIGYHRDLRRLARLRSMLELVVARLGAGM